MLKLKPLRIFTLASAVTLLCGAGQGVYAHTTIKDQATEGATSYNALQIGHTCSLENGKKLPIIAQSVVIPTQSPIVTRPDPSDATKTIEIPLSDVITDAAGLAGKLAVVQDRSIFKKQAVVKDEATHTNVIAFNSTQGNLDPDFRGLVPFRFTPPTFVKSDATHCAKRLLVKIAIADICKRSKPKAGTANLWIPSVTSKFTDASIDGIGSPATLTINRKDALDPACGAGYDVTVTPSAEDVDAHLPINGYWGQ